MALCGGRRSGTCSFSDDPNFRPTHGVVGADGALYVSDWHNPIIGHMQHNLRDPMRDHEHGRIYRITAPERPLQEPVAIANRPIDELLELLKHPVNGVRERVRIELSGRETAEVIPAVQEWVSHVEASGEEKGHALLEALWVHQQHDVVDRRLLEQVLESQHEHAVVAAGRVAFEWEQRPRPGRAGHHDPNGHPQDPGAVAEHAIPMPGGSREGRTIDLAGEDVAELTIKAVVEEMRYDVDEFTVEAGQSVVLHFENPDFMPHNLMIVEPGKADEVGIAAQQMGAAGFEKQFIPDHSAVKFTTQMLNHGQSETLEFIAPAEPGDYEFVCTFPGHHIMMRGAMRVLPASR